MAQEFQYVATKLEWWIWTNFVKFSQADRTFRDYKNNMFLITLGTRISNLLGIDNRIFR